jgi:serine phosphatase RsbU (regulator of sigma subunit)
MGGVGTILTIDDEPMVRMAFAAVLRDAGYDTREAADGLEGLQRVRDSPPDLVLCDLRMPGIDGLELLSRIRAERPDLPVIVVSGAGSMTDAVEALKRGAWDYVTKPVVDVALLTAAVARALERAALLRDNHVYQRHLEQLNRELCRALAQLREDQEAGKRMQLQLLPRDGMTFGDYRLTRRLLASTYLSGDFIDYFPIDDQRVVCYVADVSGHGAASAFVTVMLRTLIRQYGESYRLRGDDTILQPRRLLEAIDRELQRQSLDKHVTMFFGVVDHAEHALTYGCGGQYPYPILCTGRDARLLDRPGRAIGLFPNATFDQERVALAPDCRLLVVSDGVLELGSLTGARAPDKIEALRGLASRDAVSLVDLSRTLGLDETVELLDDVGLLLVERLDDD